MIEKELLDILACPSCRDTVRQEAGEIVCNGCGHRYPIRQNVPVMLLEKSTSENEAGPRAGTSGAQT